MKRRTMFATLLGAVGLALPVRTETKSSACPVCKTAARKLTKTGVQIVPKQNVLEFASLAIYNPRSHVLYDREPAVSHRNDDGEIEWFWEDCQRCGCVFKAMM